MACFAGRVARNIDIFGPGSVPAREKMVTAAQIAELLAERRFDPTIAPQLESYVNEQVKGGTHDLEANLALLRFYQYNPSTTQVPIVAKVCHFLQLPQPFYSWTRSKFGSD